MLWSAYSWFISIILLTGIMSFIIGLLNHNSPFFSIKIKVNRVTLSNLKVIQKIVIKTDSLQFLYNPAAKGHSGHEAYAPR